MKNLVRFLVTLLMPVALIAAGAGVLALGATQNSDTLLYMGFALIGAGILWGLAIFLWASGGSW